ncbi:putative diacylglycerol O-acyltransferase [Mycobacterium haemophilum DSM 44634]|uniref:wax ester/triacylglycerol synthase family O-acyltransferase n=1 Tax=Mycobacterium haemophilum TaxID=29311 RepID=UPI0006553C21|nr:wax ester/triacylglycerol synthase family O-acyltransferase [Mycobacterium haemophilum]AKN18044.1 diacylglycerol O-acyltransferase [Mycobacterium haemophilum DSM 44634]MCV7342420.1 wax ester/triacylglycerol synthase family O-acyltransferase [Mycobacterium haemophilum DSM 44634]
MAQRKTLDAGSLKARDPDRQASLAIGAVAIVDGAVPDFVALETLLAERIQSIPRCTQTLRTHPFDVTTQQWIDYPGFDLTDHLRRVAVAPPGDDTELFTAIAHALERPLDLDRPLWECWVIEGLQGNQWAILMKIHHCMADDISAAHILTRLCDDADSHTFANHIGSKQVSPANRDERSWADTLWRAYTGIVAKAAEAAAGAIWPGVRATPSGLVSTMRRYSTVRVPITDVDSVCRKFGVTSNDVALAAITEGFRTVLLHRGEQPRADSLRTLASMSGRSAAAVEKLPYLPVDHEDPVQRLQTVHNRLAATRHDPRGNILESAINRLPITLRAHAIQLLNRLPKPGIVTLATNAPGPRDRLRLMGQRMERVLPIPPTALKLNTGVAVLSYGDELVFGITADYDAAPDIERLTAGIELEITRLVALSHDSVLLFTKDRHARSSGVLPSEAPRRRAATPSARARR